ncbi:MAG TPA: glycosyltransferase family 39 protein, partial [Chloroflexia bacterium]|nr:glycosyltransferase family 39 protein [Chloroflexia bacterium]
HADYAENANIARSLVEGHGLTVDYTAQFYTDRPQLTHPADTWPLLQPLLIAPFFMLFGPETWAAKLPNLLILLALAWAVFYVGSRLWDRRAGLVAGLLTLLHTISSTRSSSRSTTWPSRLSSSCWRGWCGGQLMTGIRQASCTRPTVPS